MEVKSLRRAQSLRSVSTAHVVSWTETGLRDKRTSVSQLVAHYQNSPGRKTKEVVSEDIKHELSMQIAPIPVSENVSRVETQARKTDIKEKSRVSPLSRSKSMESLPRHRPTGTTALRALFESKVTTQPESKSSKTALQSVGTEKANKTSLTITLPNNKDAEDTKPQVEAEVNSSHDEQEKGTKEVQVITKSARTKEIITRSDRRKTISGIYSEKRSSPEEDKRRSIADFRDNSPLYGPENPSISVKALSALYLSKVAAAEPAGTLLKPDQNPTSPTGKRPIASKMAEGAQNSIAFAPESDPPSHHLETSVDEHERAFTSPPPTREAMSILHQRRQKCELRRLLKHTYPELKNVESLVEKEMADILNIDPDTGYQNEVQSRCWLFENHEINSVDFHDQKLLVKKEFQEGDIKKNACLFEQPTSNFLNEENKTQLSESEEETSEQSIRVDVKATRRMFETQSMAVLKERQSPCQRRNIVSEEESGSDQKPKNDSETDGKQTSNIHHNRLTTDFIGPNEVFVGISTAKQVFETILHDKENVSPTNDSFSQEEMMKANVKNRAQMFESTPLDKINQQTKDESETILESMQETLVSLCNFSIMHSDGTILETNEIGHIKKARYHFIQKDTRPDIDDEEIVTGSIKSIMLQMLAGTSLNTAVTFLKEDSQGNVEIQKVDVPTHQLPFTQDKECRTANVVQITEDLLSQEKSTRKGVLIQDGTTGSREITVYVLFIHREDSTGVKELGKTEHKSLPSSLKINSESEKGDLKTDISLSESSLVVDTNKSNNVQLCQSCIEKGELDNIKRLQETSYVDIDVSTGESEKTNEIIPGNVNNIKVLFTNNIDNLSFKMHSKENKPKVSPTESLINNENNTEESNQAEICTNTGGTLKNEKNLQDQDILDDGAVLQAELVDVVEDDELVNLQIAIMNLHQATMEAKALQQSVQAKLDSHTNQTQQICDLGSVNHDFTLVKNNDSVSAKEVLSQFSETQKEDESKEDVIRGSIQAALDSLGKSNFNVSKGDFRAAMIYRNSAKGYAGHKKTVIEQSSDRTKENKPSTSCSAPLAEQEALKSLGEGTDTTLCERQFENKPVTTSPSHVSLNTPVKNRKTPIGPKPAIPPKPDHLKIKLNPLGTETDAYRLNKCQVPATSSKPQTEQIKEPSTPKPSPDPASHEDAICTSVQHTDANEPEPRDTSMSNTESPENTKLNGVHVVGITPKSTSESTVSESSTGFHGTLQKFGVKQSGSVAPVKPKRIKMAKENVKNTTDNVNSTILETETAQEIRPSPHNNDSSGETCKIDSNNREERQDKSDDQQVSGVVRRKKKRRGETEDERRQRLSVHMDEIMKGNVPAVMEIFDKLKKQEELKNILSKVEEIEEDTNQVDVSSLRNIFESVSDWIVPQEKKIKPKIVMSEHLGASEPEVKSSMEVAFGDLEKAGADIIRLKDQTLARLMDIEEAIKKALYSVSTLKSDSDIVGLSGLFRESMVAVQGSPSSGNIRKISIGSSKSPKAQNKIGRGVSEQSTAQKNPELFIPATKQRSTSPASPSFISIQSAARKSLELPSPQISSLKAEPKEEAKPQCCCSVPSDRRQCSLTKGASSSPPNPQRQVSVLEVQTMPEVEKVIGTKTIRENYERTDYFGNKFYSSKTSTVVTTQPETRTTSRKLIMSSPATSEIVTYPRINTPVIREDHPPL